MCTHSVYMYEYICVIQIIIFFFYFMICIFRTRNNNNNNNHNARCKRNIFRSTHVLVIFYRYIHLSFAPECAQLSGSFDDTAANFFPFLSNSIPEPSMFRFLFRIAYIANAPHIPHSFIDHRTQFSF